MTGFAGRSTGNDDGMTERSEPPADEPTEEHHDGIVDRLRGSGVGVEDPNIVGDVGPTDVPPGKDPEGGLVVEEPLGADVTPPEDDEPDREG